MSVELTNRRDISTDVLTSSWSWSPLWMSLLRKFVLKSYSYFALKLKPRTLSKTSPASSPRVLDVYLLPTQAVHTSHSTASKSPARHQETCKTSQRHYWTSTLPLPTLSYIRPLYHTKNRRSQPCSGIEHSNRMS